MPVMIAWRAGGGGCCRRTWRGIRALFDASGVGHGAQGYVAIRAPAVRVGDRLPEPAMDQFPDDVDIERDIIGTVSEDELRNRLWAAFRKLPRQQQQLLYALYRDGKSCVDIGSETRQSRQAVQQRHQKAIDQLRYYMLVADNKEFDIQDMQNMHSYK